MIPVNQLRVGSWVYILNEDGTPVPHKITLEFFKNASFGNLMPIPLTPEILEHAGFEDYGIDELGEWINYRLGEIDIWVGVGGYHFNYEKSITILETMHELQNLYFALTGEELEINF